MKIKYNEKSKRKDIVEYFDVSEDINGTILIYLRFNSKYYCLDVHPQVSYDISLKEVQYKSYLMCFVELDEELVASFDIDIPLDVYDRYIGMSNFHYSKNKEEYCIFIHKCEFDYAYSKTLFQEGNS